MMEANMKAVDALLKEMEDSYDAEASERLRLRSLQEKQDRMRWQMEHEERTRLADERMRADVDNKVSFAGRIFAATRRQGRRELAANSG
jgi:hypothetical protein